VVLKKETKNDGIITWKNIEKVSIAFGIIVNIVVILIMLKFFKIFNKINNKFFFILISFFTALLSIFIVIGYFFHYIFYIKALKEINFEEILKKIKRYLKLDVILLILVTLYFIKKIIEAFSINDPNKFILALTIYLTNYCLVFISITSLLFYLIIKEVSKIFLEPQLKTIFLVMNSIIIIFFLNVLMTITALKDNNFNFLIIVFISNISLIYSLFKVSKEYLEKINEL